MENEILNGYRAGLSNIWAADREAMRAGRLGIIGASDVGGCPVRVAWEKANSELAQETEVDPPVGSKAKMLVGKVLEGWIIACIMDALHHGWEALPTQQYANPACPGNIVTPDLVLRSISDPQVFMNIEIKTMGTDTFAKLKKACELSPTKFDGLIKVYPKYAYQVVNQLMALDNAESMKLSGCVFAVDRDTLEAIQIDVPEDTARLVSAINLRLAYIESIMKREAQVFSPEGAFLFESEMMRVPDYHECRGCALSKMGCPGYSAKADKKDAADPKRPYASVVDGELVNLFAQMKEASALITGKFDEVKDEAMARLDGTSVDALHGDGKSIKLTRIEGTRFDTTALKKHAPDVAEMFTKPTITKKLEVTNG